MTSAKNSQKHIAFISPHSILDHSSGASQSIRTILESMSNIGWFTSSFSATCLDSPNGLRRDIVKALKDNKDPILKIKDKESKHLIFRTSTWQRGEIRAMEEAKMFAFAMNYIKVNKPDFVLTFGGMLFEQLLVNNLQKLNIKTCMYLVNENYLNSNDFLSKYDYVFTDSDATKNLYKKQRSDIFNIGKFISTNKVASNIFPDRKQFITMINPSPEKGIEIFIKLSEEFKNDPRYQFLVVESRGKFEKVLPLYGKKVSDFNNIKIIPFQENMAKIYAVTKVLLLPSLWHESGSRVAVESVLNNIPVVATNRGGNKEMLRGSGILIEPPKVLREKMYRLPPDFDITPWVTSLKKLIEDNVFYENEKEKTSNAALTYDLSKSAQNLEKLLLGEPDVK